METRCNYKYKSIINTQIISTPGEVVMEPDGAVLKALKTSAVKTLDTWVDPEIDCDAQPI